MLFYRAALALSSRTLALAAGIIRRHRISIGVSGALPGSVHGKKAEWIRGVLAELEAAGLLTVAYKG